MDQVAESVTKRETPSAAERAAAVRQKGGYIYRIDPEYDPAGRVPPEVIQGAWAVNAAGEIVGEFERNPNYHGA